MRFGIAFANSGPFAEPELAATLARIAEDLGFESLWTVEHVVVPEGYESQYPYSRTGRMPGGEDVAMPDPLVWLAYVAAVTERIRLATGIVILPQRHPLLLAKEAATLDRLSGGRFMLGVGVGWLKEELDLFDVPFERRGRMTDELIEALRVLWREDVATFEGDHAAFRSVRSEPKPVQAGGVPIVVGGHTPAAARRAGRLGDGFFPARTKADEIGPLLDEMRAAAAEAGRDAAAIEVTTGAPRDLDGLKALADLGVSRVTVPPMAFDEEGLKRYLGTVADTLMSPLA